MINYQNESILFNNSDYLKKIVIVATFLEIKENTLIISRNSEMSWDENGKLNCRNIKKIKINNKKININKNIDKLIKLNKKTKISVYFNEESTGDIRINVLVDNFNYLVKNGLNIIYHKISRYNSNGEKNVNRYSR